MNRNWSTATCITSTIVVLGTTTSAVSRLQKCLGDDAEECFNRNTIGSKISLSPAVRMCESGQQPISEVVAGACNATKLKQCGKEFGSAIGIQGVLNGTAFDRYFFEYQVEHGVAGFKKICNATRDLKKCLGTSWDDCNSPLSIGTAFGLGFIDASYYLFEMRGLAYSCVEKPQAFDSNINCIAKVVKTSRAALEKCGKTLADEMDKTFFLACRHLDEFSHCIRKQYKACEKAVDKAMCEQTSAQATACPGCVLKCK